MEPLALLFPVLYAIFLWWFTTGLIIVVYDRARWLTRLCFIGATVALGVALGGLILTRGRSDLLAVYIAITCGVVIWAWQVAGFYLGFVTGLLPDADTPNNTSLRWRFRLAVRASLHHELMALAFALLLAAVTWNTPNRWGLWIYLTLWLMHTSAKLNVFLGVRNFEIDFLPRHLHHLEDLLDKRNSNSFFPVSIVVASAIALWLIYRAIMPGVTENETIGLFMIATIMSLGILEHWLLVLPVPATLYGWGIRALQDAKRPKQQTPLKPQNKHTAEQRII